MASRVFLGWDRPFLGLAVEWLIARKEKLPHLLVIVPTAQSGRRLREALAEAAGALLAPRFATPGNLLQPSAADVAPEWAERLAWAEVLEAVDDWEEFAAAFPEKPGEGRGWAGPLALEMTRLRRALQENAHTLRSAAPRLAPETGRWEALAGLESRVERLLRDWNFRSRSAVIAAGVPPPLQAAEIVLAGVPELPPVLERALTAWNLPATALIGAPETESDSFSELGIPLENWSDRPLPWPETGSVEVFADPRQQAAEALLVTAGAGTASPDLAVAAGDAETGAELARAFTRGGWPAFHPGAELAAIGLWRWFRVWSEWLARPRLAVMQDLLALPETGALIGKGRAAIARKLAALRDQWLAEDVEQLARLVETTDHRDDKRRADARAVVEAARKLAERRREMLGAGFPAALRRLLGAFGHPDSADAAAAMTDWLDEAESLMRRVPRSPAFWIESMLAHVAPPAPQPPAGRAVDIQGWLELFHEPGRHLVLCGLNDGYIPSRIGGEPWLGEQARDRLGLPTNASRAARDAFLYTALLNARRDGRVDLFCGKSGAGGEALLPSRLLLAAEREELPERVRRLFREVEPPEAGVRRVIDWQWKTRQVEPPERIPVTSLGDYLACPFRYYLKHCVGMRRGEADRREWNARDFGVILHDVLENWGRDEEARDFSKIEPLHDWLAAELDRLVRGRFGERPPLAIRIQREAMIQRLGWFARVQACERAEGWRIVDVERKFELKVADRLVVGKIDRIERHADGRWRVMDYKTGAVDKAAKAHRSEVRANTVIPEHLSAGDCPALHDGPGGKPLLWRNLQLPVYAVALVEADGTHATPGYFRLPAKEADAGILEWEEFDPSVVDEARRCMEWVVNRVAGRCFWPPAEKVKYDDYRSLAPDGDAAQAFLEPGTDEP